MRVTLGSSTSATSHRGDNQAEILVTTEAGRLYCLRGESSGGK